MLMAALGAITLAMAVAPASDSPLRDHRWTSRVMIVFSETGGPDLVSQVADFERRQSDVKDRDMLILTVVGQTVSDNGSGHLPRAADLRRHFEVAADVPFRVILVGKDGTEKLRRDEPVSADEIFALIDSMPMRQSEKQD